MAPFRSSSGPRCLRSPWDLSAPAGGDGGTKPWKGGTGRPLGARGVLCLHPGGRVSRVSQEPPLQEGQDRSREQPWGGVQVEPGGLGGARAQLGVPVGRAFLAALCSREDRRRFYSAFVVAPRAMRGVREAQGRGHTPESSAEGDAARRAGRNLETAGAGGRRRGRRVTHLRAGERRGHSGPSPATTTADSHPSTQPVPTVSPLAGEEGQVRCQQGGYLGSPRRHSPAPACFSALPVRSFSAGKSQCD